MTSHPRPSKPSTWLLAAMCAFSQVSLAGELESSPQYSEGPFIGTVASSNATDADQHNGGTDGGWKPRAKNRYVGLSIGKARFNLPCIDGMVCRRNGRSITLHAGGDFSQRLGFELAYMRMSNMAHQGNALQVKGLNLNLLGEMPLGSRLALTGRVGTNYAWTRIDMPTATGSVAGKARGFGVSYGVGLTWDVSERWSAATDLNRHDFKFVTGRDTVDTASLSLRYRY